MNKYTKTYVDELQKNAFIGNAIRGAIRAGAPLIKNTLDEVMPTLRGAANSTTRAAKQVGEGAHNLAQGYTRGLGEALKDYSTTLRDDTSILKKLLNLPVDTLRNGLVPTEKLWMAGVRPSAGRIGEIAGAATPLAASLIGLDSLLPNPKDE